MYVVKLPVCLLGVVLLAQCAYCQATPSPDPGYKPTVFPKPEPKEDKSRLRDLKGLVKDETDTPVEGAIVKLKNSRTGKVVQFITKKDGTYLFYDLNMDTDYDLQTTRDGFTDAKKTLSKYDSRKPATLNIQMERKNPS